MQYNFRIELKYEIVKNRSIYEYMNKKTNKNVNFREGIIILQQTLEFIIRLTLRRSDESI